MKASLPNQPGALACFFHYSPKNNPHESEAFLTLRIGNVHATCIDLRAKSQSLSFI